MDNFTGMFSMFELGLGVYMLYCSITNGGQLFKNENIKQGMEEKYHRLVRLFGFILGPMMVALGVVDYLNGTRQDPALLTVMYVLWGLTLAGIALLFIFTFRMTDRKKAQAASKPVHSAPRAAFEFDEEDTKKPDENAPSEKGLKKK